MKREGGRRKTNISPRGEFHCCFAGKVVLCYFINEVDLQLQNISNCRWLLPSVLHEITALLLRSLVKDFAVISTRSCAYENVGESCAGCCVFAVRRQSSKLEAHNSQQTQPELGRSAHCAQIKNITSDGNYAITTSDLTFLHVQPRMLRLHLVAHIESQCPRLLCHEFSSPRSLSLGCLSFTSSFSSLFSSMRRARHFFFMSRKHVRPRHIWDACSCFSLGSVSLSSSQHSCRCFFFRIFNSILVVHCLTSFLFYLFYLFSVSKKKSCCCWVVSCFPGERSDLSSRELKWMRRTLPWVSVEFQKILPTRLLPSHKQAVLFQLLRSETEHNFAFYLF